MRGGRGDKGGKQKANGVLGEWVSSDSRQLAKYMGN